MRLSKIASSKTALALVAGAMLVGAGTAAAQDATPAGDGTFGGRTVEEIAAVQPAEPYRLLAVVKTLSNEYWQTMERGYQEAAANTGVTIDVLSVPTEQDTEQQLNQVQSALAQGYDAIMVSPITSNGCSAPTACARRCRGRSRSSWKGTSSTSSAPI